jgi:hypothetical protein
MEIKFQSKRQQQQNLNMFQDKSANSLPCMKFRPLEQIHSLSHISKSVEYIFETETICCLTLIGCSAFFGSWWEIHSYVEEKKQNKNLHLKLISITSFIFSNAIKRLHKLQND